MTIKSHKNKFVIISFGLSFLATGIFIVAAWFKAGVTILDVSLGAIWVFVLSLIITFSFAHKLVKNDKQTTTHH